MCSLVMLFTGYFRPMVSRMANTMELINDVIIVNCSYFLIIFSAMVADPWTRYQSAWPLIGLVCFLILLNLSVIMVRGISSVIHTSKLRMLRYKNRKIAQKRARDRALMDKISQNLQKQRTLEI